MARKVDEQHVDWSKFKYIVYDVPTHQGTYQERYNLLGTALCCCFLQFRLKIFIVVERLGNCLYKYVEVAPKEEFKGTPQQVEEFFQDILDKGGEGVILRDPNSPQQGGRSSGYLKYKVPFLPVLVASSFVMLILTMCRGSAMQKLKL